MPNFIVNYFRFTISNVQEKVYNAAVNDNMQNKKHIDLKKPFRYNCTYIIPTQENLQEDQLSEQLTL